MTVPFPFIRSALARNYFQELYGQRSEVRSQRSEVRGQKSEVRGQRSEVRVGPIVNREL